jgi:hypothetical protein
MATLVRVAISFILATAVTSGCHSQQNVIRSDSPLTEDQFAVYTSFFDNFSSLHVKNLANRTARLDLSDVKESNPCLQGVELENLPDSRRTTHPFSTEITKGRELRLVDAFQQAKIMEQEEKSDTAQTGSSKHDGTKPVQASSFLVLSEIAFDKTQQYAVLNYVFVCGTHCKTSQTFVMERVGPQWKVKGRPCTMTVN